MIEIKNTINITQNGVKIALYGDSGVGKTFQISTLENPLIISTERGLLTIQQFGLPYIEVSSKADWLEAQQYVWEHKAEYKTIVMDSMTEFANIRLKEITSELQTKNPNKSDKQLGWDIYSELGDELKDTFSFFHSLPCDTVLIFLSKRITDEDSGRTAYTPSAGSDKFSLGLPARFDEVLALRTREENGYFYRYVQTRDGDNYKAKDRSRKLLPVEDLTASTSTGQTTIRTTLGNLIQQMRYTKM